MRIKASEDVAKFIKVTDIGKSRKATIVDCVPAEGSEFSDYFLRLKAKGVVWTLGLKGSGQNATLLVARFGEETDRWKGKVVTLKPDNFKGRDYVRIV